MYVCKVCGKESSTKSAHGGHVGSHVRYGTTFKNSVLYCVFQCQLENCQKFFNVGRTVAKREAQPKFCSRTCWNKKRTIEAKQKLFRWQDGTFSDKTIQEIEDLKASVTNCQICGMEEVARQPHTAGGRVNKLAADHDHETGRFRGLLCVKCNIQLGWFEKYKGEVLQYLDLGSK